MSQSILNVFYNEIVVGKLYSDFDNTLCFEYSSQWLKSKQSFAISHQMPLEDRVFTEESDRYFSNLLPEGRIRMLLAKKFGVSEENDFQLLKALGEDCAGAFQIGFELNRKTPDYKKITLKEIKEIYRTQPIIYFGLDQNNIRLSLAGAQDKIAVKYEDGKIYLPQNGAPSTHILKLPSKDYVHLPENEQYILEIGRYCELNVNPSQILSDGDFHVLLVERFDRNVEPQSNITRLHQEDFCQALGYSYKNKYQEEGGPTFEQCFRLVELESSQTIEDLNRLLKWLVFNICVGNCDHHGKNLSLLMAERNLWRLTPFYDLLCTKIYPTLSHKQAMSVGGSFDGGNLSRHHWEEMLKNINYSSTKFYNDICYPILETVRFSSEIILENFKHSNKIDFLKQIQKVIQSGCKRINAGL